MSKVILPTSPNDPSINPHGKTRAIDNRAKPKFVIGASDMETDDTEVEADTAANSEKVLQKNMEKVNSELSPLPAFMNTPKNKTKGNAPSIRSSLTLRSPPASHPKKC
jgi:hypothetical protein